MQFINLDEFDLLAVSGEDARKFLQGQVTCDVTLLSPAHSLEGAICNLKGRVIGDFRLVEHGAVCYLLLATGMGAVVQAVLNKYIVFFKAECRQLTTGLQRTGLIGSDAASLLQTAFGSIPEQHGDVVESGNQLLLNIPGAVPRFEHWQLSDTDAQQQPRSDLLAKTLETGRQVPSSAWDLEDIRAGIIHVTPELSEQHLPEALNYDLSGVINFSKGCYTGQEIVARMFYRGTAKKRLYYGVARGMEQQPQSISCLSDGNELPADGELLRCVPDQQGAWHVLAILPTAAAEPTASVYLNGDESCTVTVGLPPYTTGNAAT